MKKDPSAKVLEALDNGLVDKDYLINAMLNYLSWDEVEDMCHKNEIPLDNEDFEDDDDSEEEDLYDERDSE